MKTYNVELWFRGDFEVEAENERQASEMAFDLFMEDPALYECNSNVTEIDPTVQVQIVAVA